MVYIFTVLIENESAEFYAIGGVRGVRKKRARITLFGEILRKGFLISLRPVVIPLFLSHVLGRATDLRRKTV